jgi:hypothetical protein
VLADEVVVRRRRRGLVDVLDLLQEVPIGVVDVERGRLERPVPVLVGPPRGQLVAGVVGVLDDRGAGVP